MAISFSCSCGHKFRTGSQNAGKQATCPKCKASITIPEAEDAPAEETAEGGPDKAAQKAKAGATKKPATAKKRSPTDSIDDLLDLSDIGSFEAEPEVDEDGEVEDDGIPRRRRFGDEDQYVAPVKKYEPPKREEVIQVIGAGVATILIGCILIVLAITIKTGGVKPPKEFQAFKDDDIPIKCEIPKGWKVQVSGGTSNVPPTVKIESGPISITYRASTKGSAIQDMAQAAANKSTEISDDMKPVVRVHEFQADKFKQELPQYTEVGKAEKIETGYGEGRISIYTAASGLAGKEIGYRATLLTSQHQWNVICKTNSKKQFEQFKPVFQRIIKSTGR